jgi:hypothetical protein
LLLLFFPNLTYQCAWKFSIVSLVHVAQFVVQQSYRTMLPATTMSITMHNTWHTTWRFAQHCWTVELWPPPPTELSPTPHFLPFLTLDRW